MTNFSKNYHKTLKFCIFGYLFLGGASCQSLKTRKLNDINLLSRQEKSLFSNCRPNDGATQITVSLKGSPISNVQSEWISKKNGSWQFQAIDDFGRTLLDLKWNSDLKLLRKDGALQEKIKGLKLNEHGYLEIGNLDLALKVEEIPCLLMGNLPSSWLPLGQIEKSSRDKKTMTLNSKYRNILVNIDRNQKKQVCTILSRNKWYDFFSPEITWCFKPNEKNGTLKLPKEYSISWENQP